MAQEDTLGRLIKLTERYAAGRPCNFPLDSESAISQDAYIFGIDVDDYVADLEIEFGPAVRTIPWLHYTDQTASSRGCRACIVAPFLIPWLLFKKLVFGPESLPRPDPRNHPYRLTLRQIADAIDDGGWPEDYWP
jgi:hypothetical protein